MRGFHGFRLEAGGGRGVDVSAGPAGPLPEDAGDGPGVRSGQEGGAGPVSCYTRPNTSASFSDGRLHSPDMLDIHHHFNNFTHVEPLKTEQETVSRHS